MAVTTEPENPLTEGLERLPVHPTTLVVFGATGDLAKRKLLPAIYNLGHEGALPERFNLVGVSRGDMTHEQFRELAIESITSFSRRPPDRDVLEHLLEDVRYVAGSFDEASVYATLSATLDEFDAKAGQALNRAFYLSTAPAFFPVIVGARIACSTLTFSSRTSSAENATGGSMHSSVSSCSMWFWIRSRRAPAES